MEINWRFKGIWLWKQLLLVMGHLCLFIRGNLFGYFSQIPSRSDHISRAALAYAWRSFHFQNGSPHTAYRFKSAACTGGPDNPKTYPAASPKLRRGHAAHLSFGTQP